MINTTFERDLLAQLRLVLYQPSSAQITDDLLTKALTINEELLNLGYTLRPADLFRLAVSPSADTFTAHLRTLLPQVKALPMYPDFPRQVMQISEAEFRMHQLIHYFSTYGLEDLLGIKTSQGWLPSVPSTEKTQQDEALLSATVLELVPEADAARTAYERILSKRERVNLQEKALLSCAIPSLDPEQLTEIQIPFKENLIEVFEAILASGTGAARIVFWQKICRHTGDVLRCVWGLLPVHHFHLHTGEKRAIVKLLESYPAVDFRANLILSRGKREQHLVVLQYLDYNRFSRSSAHKEAVRALRSGELRSWESAAESLLSAGKQEALDYIARRPGMMLRMLRRLLRLGYPEEMIREKLLPHAASISPYTVISILNALDAISCREPREELYRNALAQMEHDFDKSCSSWKKINSHEYLYLRSFRYVPSERQKWLAWAEDPVIQAYRFRDFERDRQGRIDTFKREYAQARSAYERALPYTEPVCRILRDVLKAHFEAARTELYGRKVCLQMPSFDLQRSRLEAGTASSEGGYLPSGIAIRIPENVRHLRFFVYWNDPERVDLDLHATAQDEDGKEINIGWDADFNKGGIVHSGDITHSNAAEYIDLDLDGPAACAETEIHIYDGKDSFNEIEECYVGMMAVRNLGENVALYDPKNCFFTHRLRSDDRELRYGSIDVKRRLLFFKGDAPSHRDRPAYLLPESMNFDKMPLFSLKDYLDLLLTAQKAVIVSSPEEADYILAIEKGADERTISLRDRNFWLDT